MFTTLSISCTLTVIINLMTQLQETECTSISFKNSWYIFSESGKRWEENRDFCRCKGGDLVSIETEQEWKFINKEIQKRSTTDGNHEWDIGLIKKDANWTWVSGIPLTICKWSKGAPSGDGDVGQIYKKSPYGKQGLFNDLAGNRPEAFICEISKGYCRNYSGIPCTLEYGNKSWVQNCNFTDYTCQLKCIISCEGVLNRMLPRFWEEKQSQTYSPLAARCKEIRREKSSLYQICNTTKCNMTSGEKTFAKRQSYTCNRTICGRQCIGIRCTQKCRERKTVASSSTSPSPSLPPTLSSLPPTPSSLPPTPSSLPPTSSSSSPPTSSLSSQKLQKLTSEYLIKLNRINISNSSSLQEAVRVFELFITGIENITKSVKSFSGTEETKTLKRSTFRVAVTFEKFAVNYSKLHTIGRKSAVVIDSQRMGLSVQKVYRQKQSDFYFGEQEWKASIKVPSANFANNVSMVVGIVYKDLHNLLIIDQPIEMKTSNS
ncbi:uncharacterized protein LOC111338943 [Stylophora pistillata]|uniref:uncharacterized protein LOC111338943 n=1 Tax=Stylophora pistillata TaxID=50429 RepID=UPI000C04189E|nr:uncharacterized protein LOC111338943 [Stylophora pistillata]